MIDRCINQIHLQDEKLRLNAEAVGSARPSMRRNRRNQADLSQKVNPESSFHSQTL